MAQALPTLADAPQRAWIGLGANLGDPLATLHAACTAIAAWPQCRLVARSSPWRSAPLDADGPSYVNAVLALDTLWAPLEVLDALHSLEQAHGRQRPYRHAPRTLDLDLLLHGDQVCDGPRLVLPHPRMHQRAFVLAPLLELEPALEAPGLGRLSEWWPQLAQQAVERLPDWPDAPPTISPLSSR